MKTVSAAEANRQFSNLMRGVVAGETVVVTSHGRPLVKIVPASEPIADEDAVQRKLAKQRLMEYLRSRPRQPAVTWTREELYEDEPYPDTFK